jgi:glycosyltransferase involved in cell wall biosynthesis
MSTKTKVLLCGTIPSQNNGYSKVVYELSKKLAEYKDIDLHIFGFQNFHSDNIHEQERKLPDNITIYDAYANEEPKKTGFGDELIVDYIKSVNPHIVIVYNDLVVLYRLIRKMQEIPEAERTFKIVPYIDLVYKSEKNALIKFLQDSCDGGIMFTEYWKEIIKGQGFTKPLHVVEHGFDKMNFFPIDKEVARNYFNLDQKDFIILNLNRQNPRKRWDTCFQAFVKFISTHPNDPIKLLVGTAIQGSWDLIDLFVSECRKYGLDPEVAKKHLIIMNNPQKLSDKDVNILYNCADVGINSSDGEGFGLCSYEHAAMGVPQILANVGGIKDCFTLENSFLVEPKWSFYVDSSRDIVGGEAEVCDYNDFTQMFEQAYSNRGILQKFGQKARKIILEKYKWEEKAKKFYDAIIYHTKDMVKDNIKILPNSVEFIMGEKSMKTPESTAQNKLTIVKEEIYDSSKEEPVDIDSKPENTKLQIQQSESINMNIPFLNKKENDTNDLAVTSQKKEEIKEPEIISKVPEKITPTPITQVDNEISTPTITPEAIQDITPVPKEVTSEKKTNDKNDTMSQILAMQQQLNQLIAKMATS